MPTRQGDVAGAVLSARRPRRGALLLIPGIHSMGIDEPRLHGARERPRRQRRAGDDAGAARSERYRITPQSTDVIEDAVAWMARQHDLAPDGRVGIVGISFAGGLSIVAAGRPSIRDKVAYVLSFGGHGDLPRVMRYLATGEELPAPGVETHPPHDYGVAVILLRPCRPASCRPSRCAAARRHRDVPARVAAHAGGHGPGERDVREGARDGKTLPEPSRTYMTYVNDRSVGKLGPALVPYLAALGADDPVAFAAARRAAGRTGLPAARRRGHGDSAGGVGGARRRTASKGVDVHVLFSHIITHAELDIAGATSEAWKLVSFWTDVLNR